MQKIRESLKVLICEALHLEDIRPEDIADEEPLFGEGLGLDSVDALELAMEIESRYGVRISRDPDDTRAFGSVAALANFLREAGVDEEKVSAGK